ncbi:MAG: hypothetical protein J6W30_01400 [Bacteroidales bacterium]|nr:hypothetical protein [Bacteroidales bacterium]
MGWKNAVERNEAADADSLGLCGGRDKQVVEPWKRPCLGPGAAEAVFMKRSEMKAVEAEPAPRRGFWNGGTP